MRPLLLLALLVCGTGANAQASLFPQADPPAEETPVEEDAAPAEEVAPPAAGELAAVLPVYDEWDAVAGHAEERLREGDASTFALGQLWDELFEWRNLFETMQDKNAGRIDTLTAQIAALSVPEGQTEPGIVAARRAALQEQIDALRAPRLLAQEAFARAQGLMTEVDAQLRARDFADLERREASPLNPTLWPEAAAHLANVTAGIGDEVRTSVAADARAWRDRAPALLLALAGLFLLTFVRHTVARLQTRMEGRASVWRFVSAILMLAIPILGLLLLLTGIREAVALGSSATDILEAALPAGLTMIVGWWLAARFFPPGNISGPMQYGAEHRRTLRWTVLILSIITGLGLLWETLISAREIMATDVQVLMLPVHLVMGLLLFRLGSLLRQPPAGAGEDGISEGRVRSLIGRAIMVIGIVAPLLAVLGYGAATQALIAPSVQTLAIIAVVVLLQRLANDVAALRRGEDADGPGPLMPLVIGFGFLLLSLPVLALVWGARGSDLLEMWARFRTGLQLGETRISPGDFMTFLLIFFVGYFLTRFLQGTLRRSVLPRTKLDVGGQNAIVSGFGYVGITLAALIAITTAGIDLSSLAIVAGALSVGIGFGLQTIVSNFVSGIILLIERPVSEGDWIEVNGQMGYVRDISVRSTRIETFDRTDVIVPNADLISQQVINWTRGNSVGRCIVRVGVAYGTDVDRVMEIMRDVAMEQPMVLHNPPPTVLFVGFGDSSLDFEVRAILRDVNWVMHVGSDIRVEINRRFAEAGIEIPFPQRDVWLRRDDDTTGTEPETT